MISDIKYRSYLWYFLFRLYESRIYSNQSIIQFHLDPVVNSDHEGHRIGHEGHSITHNNPEGHSQDEQDDATMVDEHSDATIKNDDVTAVGKRPGIFLLC